MSRAELIYPLHQRMERELSLASKDPHNKEILTRYYKVRSSQVKLATLVIDFIRLNMMSRMLDRKFEDASVQDMEDLVFKINQRHSNPNTQNKCRKILKSFYAWMKGYGRGEYPQEVKWIKLNKVPLVKVKSEDLLSYEECVRITEFATNLRDKALFQCNLDAGCRIGEILTVKVGEVKFNDGGAILYSDGKTGYQPCILTWSAKTLALWLNNHQFRNDKDAPLWPVLERDKPQQLSYAAARRAFMKCVRKAGYNNRRVWLHLLKHVSSTEDANNGMPDSFRRYKHHWTQSSRMPAVYEHLSQSIIPSIQNETWKQLTGSEKMQKGLAKEKQELELTRTCNRCDYENPRDSMFCNRCGLQLNAKKAAETSVAKSKVEEILLKLTEDPKKLDKLLSLMES